jgi:hypothetical protein
VLAVAGLCISPLTIWAQTIRMRVIPPELRGRTFGVLRTLMQSTPPLGGLIAGALLADDGSIVAATVVVSLWIGLPGLLGSRASSLDERHTARPYAPRDADREADRGVDARAAVRRRDDGGPVAAAGDQPRR